MNKSKIHTLHRPKYALFRSLQWLSGKQSTCQCRRPGFNHWVGKIPWRRMITHSSILAWEIPWTEETGWLQSMGSQKSQTQLSCYTSTKNSVTMGIKRMQRWNITFFFLFFFYMCSPSWSPLPPPSPPDPSMSSQCTRSEHLSHASNLGWWSVSP